MPYPNEHSCRLRDPGDFQADSFRRMSRKHDGKTYHIIVGRLKGKTTTAEQAYRYAKDTWSASDARTHCKDHDGTFEPATGAKSDGPDEAERRVMAVDDAELRVTDDEKPRIVGYAAKYGSIADLGPFTERIRAGAFDEVLKTSDARALKNHDPSLLLGRESSGTLHLESNTVGLRFEIDAPDTTTGQDTVEEVRRGDLAGCSFAFQVAEDDWKHLEDGRTERTIIKIGKLFDVGPVTYPAYPDTTVAVRSLVAFEAAEAHSDERQEKDEDKPEAVPRERQREIERGYRRAGRIINRNRPAED